VQKTNPQILQISIPASSAESVDPKNDVKPYNDIRVRQAMQMAIDLPTIAKTYYGGAVSPNPSTLTSNYMQGWGFPYDQWPQDLKDQYAYNPTAAKQLLAAAGFPTGFNTDIVCDANGDLDLIQIVKSYFAAVGINMEIRVLDSASWAAFVQQGHHQDALAYRTLMTLGATFDPFHMLTTFLSTYANNFKGTNDPTVDGYYTQAYAATSIDGLKQIIKDLNIRVAQQHFSVSLLQPLSYSLYQPWLKGYDSQIFGISGGGAGAQLLFFYSARFWIDQNMKKSMGY
jgi:peptide/nickel transport system substrate-binding protein